MKRTISRFLSFLAVLFAVITPAVAQNPWPNRPANGVFLLPEGTEVHHLNYDPDLATIKRLIKEREGQPIKPLKLAPYFTWTFGILVPPGKSFQVPGSAPMVATANQGTHIWFFVGKDFKAIHPAIEWPTSELTYEGVPIIRFHEAGEVTMPPGFSFLIDLPYPKINPSKLPFPEGGGLEVSKREELIENLNCLPSIISRANRTRAMAIAVAMRLDPDNVGARKLDEALRNGKHPPRVTGSISRVRMCRHFVAEAELLRQKGDDESKKLAFCLASIAERMFWSEGPDSIKARTLRLKLPQVDWDAVLIPEPGTGTKVTSTQSTGGDAGQKIRSRVPLEVLLTVNNFLKIRRKQMNELALKYEKELETRFNKAADAGELEAVEAFQAEKKNFAELKKALATDLKDASLPDLDADVSETLVRLRKVWITEKQKIHVKMDEEIQRYLKKLESDLTKTRDFTKAKIILVYRKELLSGKPGAMPENGDSKNTPPVTKKISSALLAKGGRWETIFDGKSLTGWKSNVPGAFPLVEGGMKAMRPSTTSGLLYYVGDDSEPDIFHSFEIRMRLWADGESSNSGLFFHVPPRNINIPKAKMAGIEVQIGNYETLNGQTGSIWDIKNVKRRLRGQDKPFELLIKVTESKLTVTVDGRIINEYSPKSGDKRAYFPDGGAIGIQAHSVRSAYVFERIEIRRLQ